MGFLLAVDEEISLRLVEPQHAEEIANVVRANLQHLAPWLPWATDDYSAETAAQWIATAHRDYGDRKQLALSIIYQAKLVGGIGWTDWENIDNQRWKLTAANADLGYWLAKAAEGNGIVTRAAQALTDYGFREVGLNRIQIRAEPKNDRSWAVAERLGFQYEGTLRHMFRWQDRWVDHKYYSMLAEDW